MDKTLLITIGLSISILLIFFIGVGIRILLVKNGEFKGTCSSNNPLINTEGEACSLCGALPEEQCKSDDMEDDRGTNALPTVNA